MPLAFSPGPITWWPEHSLYLFFSKALSPPMSLVFFAFRFLCFISFIFLGPRKNISYASYPRAQYIVKPTLQEVIFSSLLHTSITCHQVTCHDKRANDRILSKSQINRCRDIQTKVCEYKNTKDYNNVSHCTVLNVFEISERQSP